MKTGRPPKSDAEKKAARTFDPRYAEAARAERNEARVVALFGGDRLDAIPEPPDGLAQKAVEDYWRWARRLHETGRLTQIWVEKCVLYAVRRHSIDMRLAAGKLPKDADVKGADMFLKELGALNVDQPRDGQPVQASKWDRIGFASRVGRSSTA